MKGFHKPTVVTVIVIVVVVALAYHLYSRHAAKSNG